MSPGRQRLLAVVLLLAAGALALLSSTQTWSTVRLVGGDRVVVAGQSASPALAALGIVLLALGGALAIAGRVTKYLLGGVAVLLGAAVISVTVPNLIDPTSGVDAAVTTNTAIAGAAGIHRIIRSADGTAWPVVGAVGGVLAALVGIAVLLVARRWPTAGRRYRADARAVPSTGDPIDSWDALTTGDDPTVAGHAADAASGDAGGPAGRHA